MAAQEAPDRHRTVNAPASDRSSSDGRCKLIESDKDRTADLHRNSGARDRIIRIVQPAVNHDRTAQNIRGGTPRSRPDRTAIAERSSRNRDSFRAEPLPRSSEGSFGGSRSRSSHNRGPIAARSWSDRGAIVVRSRRDRGPIVA